MPYIFSIAYAYKMVPHNELKNFLDSMNDFLQVNLTNLIDCNMDKVDPELIAGFLLVNNY